MNDEERRQLRQKISEEQERLRLDISRLKEQVKPIAPDRAIGRLTRMEAINAKSIDEANLRTAQAKLGQLERAVKMVEDPDFGICQRCERPIPTGRLMLMPESRLCVRCASRR